MRGIIVPEGGFVLQKPILPKVMTRYAIDNLVQNDNKLLTQLCHY